MRELATTLGLLLKHHRLMLATAESCTGGWLAAALTSISGSSRWFERGFITYSNEAKREMLGVSEQTLRQFGAVSEPTVREMAEGALAMSHAQVSVAITGIAGPKGGTDAKPIGTVWIAWARAGRGTQSRLQHLSGGRQEIRRQAVRAALRVLIEVLQ